MRGVFVSRGALETFVLNIARLRTGREDYYLSQVADGAEDYYLNSGEAPGRWLGDGIQALGLAGEVDGDDLRAVLAGFSPDGEHLARNAKRTPGFDLTFRAPKSVSLLHALGDERTVAEVAAGHDAAVSAAMRFLETHACATRRGGGGRTVVRGDGFVAAAFRHRTSRAGDPALHSHVLVANVVRAEGRWGALDGRQLYADALTAEKVYQAVLRAELTQRLGVDWQPVRYGLADVRGFSRPMIETFSQRRQQILGVMIARGEHSEAAAQVATLATRPAKTNASYGELVAGWRVTAAEVGLTDRVIDGVIDRADTSRIGVPQASVGELLGPHGLTSQQSSFDRRDIVKAWCNLLPYGATLEQIERLAGETLGSPEIVELGSSELGAKFEGSLRRRDGGRIPPPLTHRFTTRELERVERGLVDGAERRARNGVAVVSTPVVDAAIGLRPTLTGEQQDMVRRLLTSGDGVEVVIGKAGAGKTFALDAARAAWQASGYTVIGCSNGARAAAQLQSDAGIPSATIARLNIELAHQPFPPGSVLVVDEAATVGTRQLARLAEVTEAVGAKLVLVGDDRQLPAIDAGGGFRALTQARPPIRLDDNRRQTAAWERAAVDAIADGRVGPGIDAFARHGRVTVAVSAEAQRNQLVTDWHTNRVNGGSGPMIALHRSDVDDLNGRARQVRISSGELAADGLEIGGRSFAVGDEVIGRRNDYRAGILNGTRGVVTAIHPDRTLTVTTDGGDGLRLSWSYLERGHLDHGYAMTVHQTQGATFDRAFVLGDDRLYREAGYVAISRAREGTQLYVVGPDVFDEHDTHRTLDADKRLTQALSGSRAEPSIRELSLDR